MILHLGLPELPVSYYRVLSSGAAAWDNKGENLPKLIENDHKRTGEPCPLNIGSPYKSVSNTLDNFQNFFSKKKITSL